ncbi:MAG: hypothetical protein U9R19_03510 [Bacteroidota bacterium]|nr:hypothetical protein [Bacteroidota bacterium]
MEQKAGISKFIYKVLVYHIYYRRSGLYKFLLRNLLKILMIFGFFILAAYIIESYIIDLDALGPKVFSKFPPSMVFLVFFISETLLGLLPPEIFILWAQHFDNSFWILAFLAVDSYFAGMAAFGIGILLRRIPKIRNYINLKFSIHLTSIKKWGGVIVIIAALFPLPWGVICLLSGMLKFPFRNFLLFATARLLRFHLYALAIYNVI